MGNCGTSATTPFVLTPSESCQSEKTKIGFLARTELKTIHHDKGGHSESDRIAKSYESYENKAFTDIAEEALNGNHKHYAQSPY